MPDPADIVTGLAQISSRYWPVALAFHLAVLAGVVAAWRWWRPSNRTVARLLVVPLGSVSLFAALGSNPFNAAVFLIVSVAAFATATRMEGSAVRGGTLSALAGAAMIAFGLVYPHFRPEGSGLAELYRAPVGLLPCPTLSLVIGLTLFLGGFGSRAWAGLLAAAGLFYGVFGAFRLGVRIDALLILGALALAATALPRLARPGAATA